MRPFEGTCEGRLSRLALNVLGDEKGNVWMYGEFAMLIILYHALVALLVIPFRTCRSAFTFNVTD
jgi:hypothetical protein